MTLIYSRKIDERFVPEYLVEKALRCVLALTGEREMT